MRDYAGNCYCFKFRLKRGVLIVEEEINNNSAGE